MTWQRVLSIISGLAAHVLAAVGAVNLGRLNVPGTAAGPQEYLGYVGLPLLYFGGDKAVRWFVAKFGSPQTSSEVASDAQLVATRKAVGKEIGKLLAHGRFSEAAALMRGLENKS